MCVLLVEDEDSIRSLLIEVMNEAGFDVIGASNGERALELSATMGPPQVIISDVNLGPGIDGFALVSRARRLWPAVPVLLMSGLGTNFAGRRCGAAERHLPKPFALAVFLRHVADLAGGSAAP